MKRALAILILMAISIPAYAVDTEVQDVTLTKEAATQLHKFSDARIKAIGYWPAEKKVVFVTEAPLSEQDVTDLKAKLLAFVPQETATEAKEKGLKSKSKLSADELTELLRLKGVI